MCDNIKSERYELTCVKQKRNVKVGVRFALNPRGNCIIASIREGGIFQMTGLKVGDIVTHVNGVTTDDKNAHHVALLVSKAKGLVTFKGTRFITVDNSHSTPSFGSENDENVDSQNSNVSPKSTPSTPSKPGLPPKAPRSSSKREEKVYVYLDQNDAGNESFECFHEDAISVGMDSFV